MLQVSDMRWGWAFALALILVPAGALSGSDSEEEELLEALGYVDSAPVEAGSQGLVGVVTHKPEKTYPGLHLITDRKINKAMLVDMEGRTLHEWWSPVDEGVPLAYGILLDDGSVLALHKDHSILRISWEGEVMWGFGARVHHELLLDGDGGFYTLLRREEVREIGGVPYPSLTDHVAHYSLDGVYLDGFDLFPGYGDMIPAAALEKGLEYAEKKGFWEWWSAPGRSPWQMFIKQATLTDYAHVNAISILPNDIKGVGRAGDFLISCRTLNRLVIYDQDTHRRVWEWGQGDMLRQHHGTIIAGDHFLVFDNGGTERLYSRTLEVEPRSGRYEVVYQGDPPESFFSSWGGSSQRLPNGNTLSWDAHHGHGVEATAEGEVVWEFYNAFANREKTDRKALYRLDRIVDEDLLEHVRGRLAGKAGQ